MATPIDRSNPEQRAVQNRKRFSPSAARNRDVIREVFLQTMPLAGRILEVGAGTGEHAVHLAAAVPNARWFTGDPDEAARASIAAWIEDAQPGNLHGPHAIDVAARDWGVEGASPYDGIVSINMIHIAPFTATRGLVEGAGRLLRPGGKLFLYGPFSRRGRHTAPSNEAFDQSLKSRDPHWGVRDLDHDLLPLTEQAGLVLEVIVDMPTNNLCVVFRRLP